MHITFKVLILDIFLSCSCFMALSFAPALLVSMLLQLDLTALSHKSLPLGLPPITNKEASYPAQVDRLSIVF